MLAIEGLNRALNDTLLTGVFDDHLRPGDHLEYAIMAATEVEASDDNDEKAEERRQGRPLVPPSEEDWNPKFTF